MTRQYGHPFVLWDKNFQCFIASSLQVNECFFTATELKRLHRRFGHPSVERLHTLLEKAGHAVEKKAIEEPTKYCDLCQKYGSAPARFKIKLPVDPVFNHTIIVDIFYLDGDTKKLPALRCHQMCSMGLRSGDIGGWAARGMAFSVNQLRTERAVRIEALSCMKIRVSCQHRGRRVLSIHASCSQSLGPLYRDLIDGPGHL